jgi:hypothetical protein
MISKIDERTVLGSRNKVVRLYLVVAALEAVIR